MNLKIHLGQSYVNSDRGSSIGETKIVESYKSGKSFTLELYEGVFDEGLDSFHFSITTENYDEDYPHVFFVVDVNEAEILAKNILSIIEIKNRYINANKK